MKVQVCQYCGSANVLIDAFVHANDPDDVRTFDNMVCENCGEDSNNITIEVEVPDDFDIYTDKFDLEKLK